MEPGEQIRAAGIREAQEEAGLLVAAEDLSLLTITDTMGESGRLYVGYFFTATQWRGVLSNREPERCKSLAFFSRHQLPSNLAANVHKVIPHLGQLRG